MTARPIVISIVMHCVVAVLAVIGLPSLSRDLPQDMPLVVMEVVQTVPETNLIEGNKQSTAKQEETPTTKRKQPAPPPKPPAPKLAAPPPSPPKPAPEPPSEPKPQKSAAEAEVIPEKPVAKPKLSTAEAVTAPKARPQPVPKSLPMPKPKREKKQASAPQPPAPKPALEKPAKPVKKPNHDALAARVNKLVKDDKNREDAANGILQNLAKAKQQAEDAEKKRKEQERKQKSDDLMKSLTAVAGNAQQAPKPPRDMQIGVDVMDRLRLHLKDYWNPPAGAVGSDTHIVDIIVVIDGESNVVRADIKNKLRMASDKYFEVAALAAQRALIEGSPLPIPHSNTGQQREFIFEFDPAYMSR